MAKLKSKRKNTSDIIIEKSAKRKQSSNPFEVHVNRQKFNILGRKLKQDRGLPGLARAKSIKKRKETLLQEYKIKDKANKFLDRRIGEKNSAMTKEDRILARFTAERLRAHKRKAMFNLGDDEILTHKGRSLAEIENFENPSSDDEVQEQEKGKLDADFVEEAHFGGGLLKKADESKGRASIIEQLIAESKKRKAEKQEAKEKTLEKTEQLDSEWQELMPMIAGSGGAGSATAEEIEKKDPYDLVMNQLKFEARGTPSDRLKSETELAAEEAEKLRELEEARLRRMRGEDVDLPEITDKKEHRSADDLDDGFYLQEDEDFEIMYDKEGNLITKISENEKDKHDKLDSSQVNEDKVTESDEEEEENEGNDDDGDDNDDSGDDDDKNKNEEEKTGESEDGESSDSEGEAVFDLADMAMEVHREEEEEEELEHGEQEDKQSKETRNSKNLQKKKRFEQKTQTKKHY
uniref:Putative nucleolar protein n=1 Tax=Rhodnius prolixus TaxID=13249 RepID=R4G4Y2_RHOPR